MKVTVQTLSDEFFVLEVSEDLELENFKAFCEIESGFPAPEIMIVHEGRPIVDEKLSMKLNGIKEGDIVILQHMKQQRRSPTIIKEVNERFLNGIDMSSIEMPVVGGSGRLRDAAAVGPAPTSTTETATATLSAQQGPSSGQGGEFPDSTPHDPAQVRDLFLANPDQIALLKQNNPRLADALLSGIDEDFARVLREQMMDRYRKQEAREKLMRADPFDVETQRLIAEEIRQKNIEANMEAAMEYSPETFGTVLMLYINCTVNGNPVKAFIDSGAQTTIMSVACAERANVMRLVDSRWSGIAKGVGTQRIIGRIHMVQLAIENDYFTTSFAILQGQSMDMLLGLDMLRRHQCCIDLRKNVLRIGTTGTETPFLSENELPVSARNSVSKEAKSANKRKR